jgi:4-oxalmesaconate hydratase
MDGERMIIDCHGHYTTAPAALGDYRERAASRAGRTPTHDGGQGHDRDLATTRSARAWRAPAAPPARAGHRPDPVLAPGVVDGPHDGNATPAGSGRAVQRADPPGVRLYPDNFAPCASSRSRRARPSSVGARAAALRRGDGLRGLPTSTPTRRAATGTAHRSPTAPGTRCTRRCASSTCRHGPRERGLQPALPHHRLALLGADTTAFMQLLTGDLFADFPSCGSSSRTAAAPCPTTGAGSGGLAQDMWPAAARTRWCSATCWFDTCVYHQAGIDCLLAVIPADNVCSRRRWWGRCGASTPQTGHHYDDTRRYLDAAGLSDARPRPRSSRPTPAGCTRAWARGRERHAMTGRHVVVRTIDRPDPDGRRARRARHGDRARGDRPAGLRRPGASARSSRAPRWPGRPSPCRATRRQPDGPRRRRGVPGGDVLVVTDHRPSTHGMFGELLATSLLARGVRALVIDAGRAGHRRAARDWLRRCGRATCRARARSRPARVGQRARSCSAAGRSRPATWCAPTTTAVVVVPGGEASRGAGAGRPARGPGGRHLRRLAAVRSLGVDIYGLRAVLDGRRRGDEA